jgi:hypothetical protein
MSMLERFIRGFAKEVGASIDGVGELPWGSHQPTPHDRLVLPAPMAGEVVWVAKFGGVSPRSTNCGSAFMAFASSPLVLCQFAKLV